MRLLKKTIEYKGFIYLQEYRNENYAIYSQWLNNDLIAYELIKILPNRADNRFGINAGEFEFYPTEKMWGDSGWTFKTFAEAQKSLLVHIPELANLLYGKHELTTFSPK